MEQSSDDARKLLSLQTINALGGVIDDGGLPDGNAA